MFRYAAMHQYLYSLTNGERLSSGTSFVTSAQTSIPNACALLATATEHIMVESLVKVFPVTFQFVEQTKMLHFLLHRGWTRRWFSL